MKHNEFKTFYVQYNTKYYDLLVTLKSKLLLIHNKFVNKK